MPPLSPGESRRSALVVGAGMAGLAAAWHLARHGTAVTVLESEPRVGGRAAGISWEGATVDPVPFRVTLADRVLRGLASASGAGGVLLPLRPLGLEQIHRGRRVSIDPVGWLRVASLPGVPLWEAARLPRLGRLLRRRYGPLLDADAPERSAPLDDRSTADFGRLYLGRRLVDRWLEPELADRGFEGAESTSRAAVLLEHQRAHWFGPATLRGPVQELLDRLRADLEVRTWTTVERIDPGATGYLVRVRERGRLETLEAEAVVLAVPADEAARIAAPILTGFEREVLAGVQYGSRIVALVGTATPLDRVATRIRVPAVEGSVLAGLQIEASGVPGAAPDGRGFVYAVAREAWSAAHLDAPVEAVGKELAAEVAALLGGAAGEPRAVQIQRYPRALPRFEVGRYRTLARLRQVEGELHRASRRLYLAGDYTMGPSLEGAARSGLRAAESLLRDGGGAGSGTPADPSAG